MIKIMTKTQINSTNICKRVERLREMDKRTSLNGTLKNELYRLERGEAGEDFVMKSLEQFGDESWHALTNLWLDYYGKFECDLVLITSKQIYIFEIKDYDGHFEYQNSQCSINGRKIGASPIHQAQKAAILLQNILDGANLNIKVRNVLIFTGEHSHVDIHSEVSDMDILMRHQLRDYIYSILEEEKYETSPLLNHNKLMKVINNYSTTSPIVHEPITKDLLQSLSVGVYCSNCHSDKINFRESFITCKCGMNEPEDVGFVRTVCEYGILYDCDYFLTKKIHRFFKHIYSEKTISKKLALYFRRVGYGRGTKYMRDHPTFEKYLEEQPFLNRGYFVY